MIILIFYAARIAPVTLFCKIHNGPRSDQTEGSEMNLASPSLKHVRDNQVDLNQLQKNVGQQLLPKGGTKNSVKA